LQPGERVRRLDGTWGTVVALHVQSGSAVRYNLTVAEDHTYTVGAGQWVVHNCSTNYGDPDPAKQVDGQPNLYKGKKYDPGDLRSQGYKPQKPRISWNIKSDMFRDFIGDDNIQQWRKVMETWVIDGGEPIENHYWQKGTSGPTYHYHGPGEE